MVFNIKVIPFYTSSACCEVVNWGSGGSTLYFAKRVKSVVSVEHDKEWYIKLKNVIKDNKIKNIDYYFKEPTKPYLNIFNKYQSFTFEKYHNLSFKKYVKAIDRYPDKNFDLIFIDGRARSVCLRKSLKKVKKGGYIILDDSERKYYDKYILNKYKRVDFYGKDLFVDVYKQTSVWNNK